MSLWIVDIRGDIEGDYKIIREYKEQDCEETETEKLLKVYRDRCMVLQDQLSEQALEFYAELDKQSTEIALLKSIIEEKGGFHKFHKHIREDSQE